VDAKNEKSVLHLQNMKNVVGTNNFSPSPLHGQRQTLLNHLKDISTAHRH
jgi:hypothetical protein